MIRQGKKTILRDSAPYKITKRLHEKMNKNILGPRGQTVRNVRDLPFQVPNHFENALDKDHYESRRNK